MPVEYDTVSALAAVLAAAVGVAVLYASWRKRLHAKRSALACGWALIALSVVFWTSSVGAEFGPVIAGLQLSVVALMFVLANRHVGRGNGRSQVQAAVRSPRIATVARHAGTFVLAVPLAGCCGTLVMLAAATLLPAGDADRLAFAILTVPVAWGVFAFWACADTRLLRPVLGMAAGSALGAAILYI
jgi:uncharacterized membrane protein YfcA